MGITLNQCELFSRGVKGQFLQRYEERYGAGFLSKIAMRVPSDQAEEKYGFLGAVPQVREMLHGRQAKGLRENQLTIINKKWESTIEIPSETLDRDKSGQVSIRISELAEKAASHAEKLISNAIIAGEADGDYGLAYDDQFFFDDDHSWGDSGTLDNDITYTVTGGDATDPSTNDAWGAMMKAIAQMLGFKDDQGDEINGSARSFMVMIPPLFLPSFMNATGATQIGGTTNVLLSNARFNIELVPNAALAADWTTKFLTIRIDSVVKPFIFQEEVPTKVQTDISKLFDLDVIQVGTYARYNVGYGDWSKIVLTTFGT